jgi:hypothetical protein
VDSGYVSPSIVRRPRQHPLRVGAVERKEGPSPWQSQTRILQAISWIRTERAVADSRLRGIWGIALPMTLEVLNCSVLVCRNCQ